MKTEDLYQLFRASGGKITTDSRRAEKDSLFFALRGENFNGNRFAQKALEAGCAYSIIDEKQYATNPRTIWVENVLESLQALARLHRQKRGIPVLAITGSNGKTTTKELVARVLSQKFRVQATQGNLNNHIGVPLTLLSLKEKTEIAVVEMGANHRGEIRDLCAIAQPDSGLITNIGKAHIEGFGSFEGVKKAKGELYDFLKQSRGTIFFHAANPVLAGLIANYPKAISYSAQSNTFFRATNPQAEPMLSFVFGNEKRRVQTQLIGLYNFENAMAAACVGKFFGVSDEKIQQAIESFVPKNNRSQVLKTSKNTVILDAYNANPTSMEAAIKNLLAMEAKRKVLILGDMLELGAESEAEHKKIVDWLEGEKLEFFLAGKEFCAATQGMPAEKQSFENAEKLLGFLKENPLQNALVLVKASRGIRLEAVVSGL